MDLYLSSCRKAAEAAAKKAATSILKADKEQDSTLYQPSFDFNLADPYCRLLETSYQSLHDPHLKSYYRRKDMLKRLKKGGYITSSNKVICSLKELNKYRQYLTSLQLDFERNYIREQTMIEKQIKKIHESKRALECPDISQFQEWLFDKDPTITADQDKLLKHRYLDVVRKELDKVEHTAEKRSTLRMKEGEQRHQDHIRRKLNLHKQIEQEWKSKEMLLLEKIGEEVKREARIEEQRWKSREETVQKKQALLEKKNAYHLKKIQKNGSQREAVEESTAENKEQDELEAAPPKTKRMSNTAATLDPKIHYSRTIIDLNMHPGHAITTDLKIPPGHAISMDLKIYNGQKRGVCHSQNGLKVAAKKSPPPLFPLHISGNTTEPKTIRRSGELSKSLCILASGASAVPAKPRVLRHSLPDISRRPAMSQVTRTKSHEKRAKKLNYSSDTAPEVIPAHKPSTKEQNDNHNYCQEHVTSEELHSIIQNVTSWVVAAVTGILYPAITKYEERLQNNIYHVADHSVLSSDSSSVCSMCSETFVCTHYSPTTTKTFKAEPMGKAIISSVGRPATPLKPPSSHKESTVVRMTPGRKGHSICSELKYSEICKYPESKTCKSDSHLPTVTEIGLRKSQATTTETDNLEHPPSSDRQAEAGHLPSSDGQAEAGHPPSSDGQAEAGHPPSSDGQAEAGHPLSSDGQAKAINEMTKIKNVFVNFKCHLQEETELILESVFQEMVSDLTQAIPYLSSVATEALLDQMKADQGDTCSSSDISSAAAEIVEILLEKLQFAVEKKCIEIFSQEDLAAWFKPDLPISEEQLISQGEEPLKAPLPYRLESMTGITEDIVHVILEKLMVLVSPQHERPDTANLMYAEEIRNLVLNIFSQSSLVAYIEDAVRAILGYIQIGLDNESLIATEETVIIHRLLDDILPQLPRGPSKANIRKGRRPRLRSPSGTEEKKGLMGTRAANGPRSRRPFPPINVPGMVLYSEDENEEVDKSVGSVLMSSIKDEEENLQVPDNLLTRRNAGLKHERNIKSPTKTACRSRIAFRDRRLKTDHNNEDLFKEKHCLNQHVLILNKDETHQIQKTSENIITSILAEMLKDTASGSSVYLDNKDGKEVSLNSRKPQSLSHQEWKDQMFSVSEIHSVAQEVADTVLKILHMTLSHAVDATKDAMSSSLMDQESLNDADMLNKDPLKIWFQSANKMKFLSSLSIDYTKPFWLESGEMQSTPETVVEINDKIIDAVFKRLKSFISPKLQKCFKPEDHAASSKPASCHLLATKSAFQLQLGAYTTKVVSIVLGAIHDELERNKKKLNLRESSPPTSFTETGFFANTEKELDSVVTNLNNDIMTSSLVICICEMLSGTTDESNVPLPSDNLKVNISYETAIADEENNSPSHCLPMQEAAPSETHTCLAAPHTYSCAFNKKDLEKNARFQVLNRIEDTLHDMLYKLIGNHPCFPTSDNEQNRKCTSEKLRTTTVLQSNIQFISNKLLEDIVTKLCSVEMDSSFSNSDFKTILEYLNTDSLSFASLMEEMTKCTDIISSMVSSVIKKDSQAKTAAPKIGSTKESHPNKLKVLVSDILKMVFAKLQGFANKNLEILSILINGKEKSSKMDWESGSTNVCADICALDEEQVQSALHVNAKKVSSAILKSIQTELNVSLPGVGTCVNNLLPNKQMLKNLVNLILDAMPPDMFSETELEARSTENYRYRPTYGNFLPGGTEPESNLEDPVQTEKECPGEKRPPEEETKSDSSKQLELEMTFKKIEVELKEPQKSPVVPIIRNILNEIFENDLLDHFNVLPLPWPHSYDIPHAGDEMVAQASVQFPSKRTASLVSEADVIIVTGGVIRTIFQKLYSVAMTERNANENRSSSFLEHTSGGKATICSAILDRNPCTFQSRLTVDKLTKVNVVEDIIQSVLTNLEIFATSKVKSLFCPHFNVTVPMALSMHQNETILSQPWLSTKESYSSDQISCYIVDHSKSGKTISVCQMTVSKLNTYATKVARQVLQGIKHKLGKQIKSPFFTHNVVASESIPCQIVDTMLDITSIKGKYENHISNKEIDLNQPESIAEKLFNKTDYQRQLPFQILDTIEGILSDICEKTLDENDLHLTASTLQCNIDSGPNSKMVTECANKATSKFLVPESCVTTMSNDMVNIVLHSLRSTVMLGINAEDSISARLPPTFSNVLPEAECQPPFVVESTNERNRENFLFARKGKSIQQISVYSDDDQINILRKQNTKKSPSDPCEENAHFITKAIFNRLKSFVMERIDMLITLDSQTREESFVSPKFANCQQDDSLFPGSNQMPSDVNILKISTAETILSQGITDHTLASYRQKHGPVIHISHGILKECADIIASTILMLIKNDIDLEMQKMYSYPNKTWSQENIIVSDTVNNILKHLYDKRSLKKSSFHSKQNPHLFTQLTIQNEMLPGQGKIEDNTKPSLFLKCVDQNLSKKENQRKVLDEIFMRNGESGQEKPTALLSSIKKVLKKVYQRVSQDVDHLPPFNEPPYLTSDSKFKTSASVWKKTLQSHINSVANDIVESIFGKMFLIVTVSLHENQGTRGELDASGSDKPSMTPSPFRRLNKAEKRRAPPECMLQSVYPPTGFTTLTPLELARLQYSPLRVSEELVQMALSKIINFALLNLKESSSPKGQSNEMRSLRSCNSKAFRSMPKPGLKIKAGSKVTSLPKFGAKPQVGVSHVKAKDKTKSGPGEKTPRSIRSKIALGLQQVPSTRDSKNLVGTKLPTAELKVYAKDIVSDILEAIMKELQTVRQNKSEINVNEFPSDQIRTASEIVNAVFQGLCAVKNNNLAHLMKCSRPDDLKLAQKNLSVISFTSPEQFSLENVSSQVENFFSKEDTFKQMFDKWQTESYAMENETSKLLMIAETVLTKILIKTKELEESVSLLNLSPLEACEIRDHDIKRASSKVEDAQAQINVFSREIVEILFEKLEQCFLTHLLLTDSKETLVSKQETTTGSKYGSSRTNHLNNVPMYDTKSEDKTAEDSGNRIAQDIIEEVLHSLESFVDLQFESISLHAFSEIVKIPVKNLFPSLQKPLMKTILPELQPQSKFLDESKSSSMISQENIQNALRQLHSFQSELLTYTANTVTDMLGIIKNKLDREIHQVESSSVSVFEENIVASEIVSMLMDQCSHFYESMIKNHPKENLTTGTENAYSVNWAEPAPGEESTTSVLKGVSCEDDPSQIKVPNLVFYSEEGMKQEDRASTNLPAVPLRDSVGYTIKTPEPMGKLESELNPSCSRNEIHDLGQFNQTMKGNSFLPEDSILQKPPKKSSHSAEVMVTQSMSSVEIGESEDQGVLYCESPKSAVRVNQRQTTVSMLKICLAAENIVNTMLLSYGFPGQLPHINESVETIKPFFASKETPLSAEQKDEEKSLSKIRGKRINYKTEEKTKSPEASGKDFPLLDKWKSKKSPKTGKIEALEEAKVIAFASQDLGPNETHLIATYVTASVVKHFKNLENRGPHDEKVPISTLSREKYESKQPLRSAHSDSSLNQFCEHLTKLVLSHIISCISDCTKEAGVKQKALDNQDATSSKVILVHSLMGESQPIPISEIALNISEIIIRILFNSDILQADSTQEMVSVKTKYIYCPREDVVDIDDLFQDLLIGVTHVLSKEIGINHQPDSKGRNESFSVLRSPSLPVCSQTKTVKRQTGLRDCRPASTHQVKHVLRENQLNYLACKLGSLVGSLKSRESKEVVDKIFNIVLDLFSPGECPDWDMDSGKTPRNMFPPSNNQQSGHIPGNNLGLSPKSVFLLNVVCEKLIHVLLEECTTNNFLINGPLSDEIPAEEYQLFNKLQNEEDEEFGYCRETTKYDISDLLEDLAETDQESMLSIISHSMVKSVMEKLSHSIQQPSRSPPYASRHLKYRTKERLSSFPRPKMPEFRESRQGKDSIRFISHDSKPLTRVVNNLQVTDSEIKSPFDEPFIVKSSLPPIQRPGKKKMNATAIHNVLHLGGMSTGVYPATFLEEIISDIFLHLCTSLWSKNENITEAQLHEMNILGVNSVVNEFNNAQVTVLRDAEEKVCFPPVYKETVSNIVHSVYNDVLRKYELQETCGDNLAHVVTSVAEQITNGILIEILDYELPLCFVGKLMPNSYYPLKAKNILHKLQNSLRELNYPAQLSIGYTTILSHSFLEDVIRRLLSQLFPLPSKASCLRKKYFNISDFNEISTCIIKKVMLAISKHKIWLTKSDHHYLYMEEDLHKVAESVYSNILQVSGSLVSIQKSLVSQSPIMVDRMASLIIQVVIENHLQPFLCGECIPRPRTPMDEISCMVRGVLTEATKSHRSQKPLSLNMGIYPKAFVEEVTAKLITKIFSPQCNTELELEKITQKIVNSINNHFNKAKIRLLCDDKEPTLSILDTDTMDELVKSVYRDILKQHGLAPGTDNKELKGSDIFVESITNSLVASISNYLLHPLFSGDLSAYCYCTLTAENIVQNILGGFSKSTKPSNHLFPYNTLLPYTFFEDIIRMLLSRIFPPAHNRVPYRETPTTRVEVNFNEISSQLISDIRMKIYQHEIRFAKDDEVSTFAYSEDDAQHLIDSVFRNILKNSESQEAVEPHLINSNNVLIDRIAGFIIKNICEQHLSPFVYGKSFLPSSYPYFDGAQRKQFFVGIYSSIFLEDVVSGVLSKIFHRVIGIVQTKSVRESEKELLETAEKLIYLITEEFSKGQVSILENAKEQLCLPPVDRDVVMKTIGIVYSRVLQEYAMESDNDFLHDTKTLAKRITKIILAETLDFQIHPHFLAKLSFKLYSKLNAEVLIKRAQYDISKAKLQRQASTIYTTILSHSYLEKIVTQILSQISPVEYSTEDPGPSQPYLSNTVLRLIDETMSVISKHAICITTHGNGKQNVISEKELQDIVDAIFIDLSSSNVYQSLAKDKKGVNDVSVTKIASHVIKQIFNHHLQSFLSDDRTLPSGPVEQTYKQRPRDPKQKELTFIVNSAAFLEEVISELLCKILYAFSHNVLAAENSYKAKVSTTDIVTTLVKSIVLEFSTSEISVADNLDENLYSSERYKEMVQKTVTLIYEKILDDYKSLIHVYKAIQSDAVSFGRKIYYLLLGEIYDYQVESLVSGELATSYSPLREENIIRNVLSTINDSGHILPSCTTVLHHSILEDIVYKLLTYISPLPSTETKLKGEEESPDYEFVDAASKLADEIMSEISQHEIRLATAEEQAEITQLGVTENFIDSMCNNIMRKFKLQAKAQKDASKQDGSFIRRIAGFIMEEIMDYHLKPFLHNEESSASNLPGKDRVGELCDPGKEKTLPSPQCSVYSATFLEDIIIDLVHKFYTLPSSPKDPKKDKEISEGDLMGMAIKFANALIGEFRRSKIKVLENAEEIYYFPPIDKDTVDKVSSSVYEEVMEVYRLNNVQKDDSSNIVIEVIAALTKKAISAFKIQPLFSGDWSSTFFSSIDADSIIQKIQHLPYKTSTKNDRNSVGNSLAQVEQLSRLTLLTSGLRNKTDTLPRGRGTSNTKENFKKEETSKEVGSIHKPVYTAGTGIMKSKVIPLAASSAQSVANKKKGDKTKKECTIRKDNEKVSELTFPTTSVKSKDMDIQGPYLDAPLAKNEEGPSERVYNHFSEAPDNRKNKKVVLEPDFKIGDKKQGDDTRKSILEKGDEPLEILPWKSVGRKREIRDRKDSPVCRVTEGKQIWNPELVQTVTKNLYSNIFEMSSLHRPADDSKLQHPLGDKVSYVTQVHGKNFASTKNSAPSASNEDEVPPNEEGKEKSNNKEIQSKLGQPDSPQNPPEKKPGVLPAGFLEDIIAELVNKLVFSSLPDTHDDYQDVTNDVNPAELCDMAMKLMDALLKAFSDAQIKVLSPDQGNEQMRKGAKMLPLRKVPLGQKEPSADKTPPMITVIPMDKTPPMHNMASVTNIPSDEVPLMANKPSVDKILVNKVVHSSLCSILQEYRSQESICKDINSNGDNLARRLASAVMQEIFQHQLHFLVGGEAPSSLQLPLESKEVIKKLQKMTQTACKECQTSSPYTIMLPHEFLENIISSLLTKIFSTVVANTKTEIAEDSFCTELDFLQTKLVSTVMLQISKDEDVTIQYVESLNPNDDELTPLVVQTIYNNLLPQFGSQEIIQHCVINGCRILSETIVTLVLREVAGNQLQDYFSGGLSPNQCAAVDYVVENTLQNVIQSLKIVQPQLKLPFNIIEEIAVNFLLKLLSMFPKVNKEQNSSRNAEMQKITTKILSSLQEYISKSHIKVVPQAKEDSTISLTDSTTIEKVVTSVYNSVLKHSGSHTSMYKDLMGQSSVLSDIIGFLMVKEISNSELQPQMEEEASNSELVLEAVAIMDKVIKIINDLKSQEKPLSGKCSALDVIFLEETLALFLAKLMKWPCASNQNANKLSKPELNKIASQLTKSVMAEIFKNNISVVASNPEESHLNQESIELISWVVDSVYNHVLQQCGTHEDLYHDIRGANRFFPKQVASFIISKVSNCPLETISSKDSSADLFGNLDVDRIVEKIHEHADKTEPAQEEEKLHQDLATFPAATDILLCHGKQPIHVSPDIVGEHLGVVSIKTQPLGKLKVECLERTEHNLELRKAAISGSSYRVDIPDPGQRKKEGCVSLDQSGRLDIKPFELARRNSFLNLRKPDITRVALLKDVRDKKDLIIQLVTHDIDRENSGKNIEEDLISYDNEVVLQEAVKEEEFENLAEDQVKEDTKPVARTVASPNSMTSMSSLKKRVLFSKYFHPKSSLAPKNVKTHSPQLTESEETQMESIPSGMDVTTSQSSTDTDCSWERGTQLSGKERQSEKIQYFIHKVMSSSSYNEEDLTSVSSDEEDNRTQDSSVNITDSFEFFEGENPNSIQTLTNPVLPTRGRK